MLSLNSDLFDLLKKNNLSKQEEQPKIVDDFYCQNCEDYSISNIKGQMVCVSCGNINGCEKNKKL